MILWPTITIKIIIFITISPIFFVIAGRFGTGECPGRMDVSGFLETVYCPELKKDGSNLTLYPGRHYRLGTTFYAGTTTNSLRLDLTTPTDEVDVGIPWDIVVTGDDACASLVGLHYCPLVNGDHYNVLVELMIPEHFSHDDNFILQFALKDDADENQICFTIPIIFVNN